MTIVLAELLNIQYFYSGENSIQLIRYEKFTVNGVMDWAEDVLAQ